MVTLGSSANYFKNYEDIQNLDVIHHVLRTYSNSSTIVLV
jgi:hypothetical protein